MMITSIVGYNYNPSRAQNFEGGKNKTIPPEKTTTGLEYMGISRVWKEEDLPSLQKEKDKLQEQINKERKLYGYPKTETLRTYNRYNCILKQIQAKGTFTETPERFYL